MLSLREFGWLSGSLAVHALVLVSALVAKLTAAPEFVQRQETPEGVAAELAAVELADVDLTAAPAFVAEEARVPTPAQPVHGEEQQPPKTTEPAAPAVKAPDSSRPPAARAVSAAAAPRAPTPVAEGEDWLGTAEPLPTAAPSTSERKTPPEDPWVARLLAAERRKQADRERSVAPSSHAVSASSPAPSDVTPTPLDVTPPGVANAEPRNLATAFTRAITQAEMANPLWETLPLGNVGRVQIVVTLAEGSLEDPKFVGSPKPSLRKLTEKALRLLRNGRFALPFSAASNPQSGAQSFDVEVTLSQRTAGSERTQYGYDHPTDQRPGRAYFTLPSGRHFEATVTPLR